MADATKERALAALYQITQAVLDVVKSHPGGVPSGVAYAACMNYMSLNQYQAMIDALVVTNKIEKRGDLLFARS